MRSLRLAAPLGLLALASPALAHVGDHGETGLAHHLAEHGLSAALIGLVLLTGAIVFFAKRKG